MIDVAGTCVCAENSGWEAAEKDVTQLSDQELNKLLGYSPDPTPREVSLEMRESIAAAVVRR